MLRQSIFSTIGLVSASIFLFSGCDFKGPQLLRTEKFDILSRFELKSSTGGQIIVKPNFLVDAETPIIIPGVQFRGPNELCRAATGTTQSLNALLAKTTTALISMNLFNQALDKNQVTLAQNDIRDLSTLPPCVLTDSGDFATKTRPYLRTISFLVSPERYARDIYDNARIYVPEGRSTLAIALTFDREGKKQIATFDTGISKKNLPKVEKGTKFVIPSRVSGQPVDLTIVAGTPGSDVSVGTYTSTCVSHTTRVICIDGECHNVEVYGPGVSQVSYGNTYTIYPFEVTFTTPDGKQVAKANVSYTKGEGGAGGAGPCSFGRF